MTRRQQSLRANRKRVESPAADLNPQTKPRPRAEASSSPVAFFTSLSSSVVDGDKLGFILGWSPSGDTFVIGLICRWRHVSHCDSDADECSRFSCVEEVGLAVGEVVGHGSVKSAARMNSAVVLFLDQVEKANRGHRDRRQLYMILKNRDEELNLRLHVRVEDFDYVIFATSAAMKCFGCGKEGHTVRACPDRGEPAPPGVGGASGAADRPGAADHRGAGERSGVTSWPGQSGVREQHTLNVTRDITRSIKDLETGIVELEKMNTGQELTEPGQIRRRAVEFYSSLYTSEYKEEDELFEGFCSELPQVSEWTNSQLEKPLQMQELQAALQNMQGRKSPGIDGLTVELFKVFWDILANDILDVFNEMVKVERVVEAGIVLRDTFTPVYPLVNPSKKITVSNAPPFIKNDDLLPKLCPETHSDSSNERDWRREWPGQVFLSHKQSNSAGVGILFSRAFSPQSVELHHVLPGHALMVKALYEKYNRNVTKQITRSFQDLETEVQHLLSCTGDQGHIEALKSKKAAIANLLGITAQGALVRSRFMNASMLDSPSKFFFSLESRNGQRKVIHCLRSDNGSSLTETTEIRKAILVNFFWDRLHWLPQAVLFLPKEEGGQGLVHLASRCAAFRLQFIPEAAVRTTGSGVETSGPADPAGVLEA
ncbi:hypothetical protein L3Q82_006652 [Scortum barcoo]|uniref:Uncharacterized protein n=1 Tax=Scortum barcoo TaxID=214431 RepID=A0ACB8WZU8_9TELE|nr:hypothetical protein L3Q82_006652 [Scortum barcoo]